MVLLWYTFGSPVRLLLHLDFLKVHYFKIWMYQKKKLEWLSKFTMLTKAESPIKGKRVKENSDTNYINISSKNMFISFFVAINPNISLRLLMKFKGVL